MACSASATVSNTSARVSSGRRCCCMVRFPFLLGLEMGQPFACWEVSVIVAAGRLVGECASTRQPAAFRRGCGISNHRAAAYNLPSMSRRVLSDPALQKGEYLHG